MICTQLVTVPGGRLDAPTLVFEKLHGYDAFEGESAFKANHRDGWFLDRVSRSVDNARPMYDAWYREFTDAAAAVGAQTLLTATTAWRLVIGWATNPGLETGLTLNRLYGFPYLPGSAVKGLVHRVAEVELIEGTDEVPSFDPSAFLVDPSAQLTRAIERASIVRAIFGSLALRRPDHSDLPATALERLEVWKERLREEQQRTAAWESALRSLETLCGAENLGGVAKFMDAVPSRASLLAASPLQLDVVTPHYSRYYADLDGGTHTIVPEDVKRPGDVIPVRFLCVRPGIQFEFRTFLRIPAAPADEAGKEQLNALGTLGAGDVHRMLTDWLGRGLEEYGIGAKTSAGYGYLEPPLHSTISKPKTPVDVEAPTYAASFLPAKLEKGVLAQRIDQARSDFPLDRQIAIATRLRDTFPEVVAEWRKSKKKVAAERLAWLEKMTSTKTSHGGNQP